MTLWMRDQENQEKGKEIGIEKGMEIGMEKGMEKGIYEVISLCREIGMPDHDISRRLQERFQLSKERAEEYLFRSIL